MKIRPGKNSGLYGIPVSFYNLVLSTELTLQTGHGREFLKLTIQALGQRK